VWIAFRLVALVLLVATAPRWWRALRSLREAIASRRWTVVFTRMLWLGAALILLMQVIPLGWRHENPAVVSEPAWDSPKTRELFERACADCHSNQTQWLWYTNIAPASWLVANDVYGGREELNVSEWITNNGRNARRAREAGEVVQSSSMPPLQYLLIHPKARLIDAERADLARGLEASLAK
jgi:mono/diheme cytochrome c family protein